MVGLMGGTFSPIHYGHLLMCEYIREEFRLEKIIFMPARIPPHKKALDIADAEDRINMVRLAIEDNPYFEASDLEMKRQGASYTVDTLKELKSSTLRYKKLSLIIGADSLVQLSSWHKYHEIFRLATVIVAARPDTDFSLLNDTIAKFRCEMNADILLSGHAPMNFSSTEIRDRVRKGLSIRYMTPPKVEAYIYEKGLYR